MTDAAAHPVFDTLRTIVDTATRIAADHAKLYEWARTRQAWIEANRDIATEFLAGTEPELVLAQVVEHARTLTSSAQAILAVVEPGVPPEEATELVVAQWSKAAAPTDGRRVRLAGTAAGEAFAQRASVRLADARGIDLGAAIDAAGPTLILPLQTAGVVLGVLIVVRSPESAPYSDELAALAAAFTDQAALAMQLAEAQRRARELDVLADRDRIARDLHDHVVQRVFAVGLGLQGVAARVEDAEVRQRLSDEIDRLQEIVHEIRTTIFDLHGGAGASLRRRLEDAIRQQTEATAIRARLWVDGPLSVVGPALADHAEAVVRESVSNAVRHSGGNAVTIEIAVADELTILVQDNGTGVPADINPSGLANLAQRAAESEGRCSVERAASGGTRVLWSVPLS
ncbi:signal transduction histidine kinase [Nocardia tenerifensis]|uniref:Signal transduction histidine kinase n=2 Tax=Nocardia tenerifensis TaxID=228006 RepID=A0A318K1M9_9NOCA|nr:ATP-binding protein [Nocardia tenerifensis]PXX62514.1 signal transduction histidine kinase [Nocardia tenerifensis]